MAEKLPPPIRLVHKLAPSDVKTIASRINEESEREEIFGAVHILMYKDRHFDFVLTGECHRNPLFTRALVAELDDELSVMTK